MRFKSSTFGIMIVAGLTASVIGGWLLISELAVIPGAFIMMIGMFFFLTGRRGATLKMEKDVISATRRYEP